MPDVTVTLRNNKISVDKQRVSVSVSKGEKVHWSSTDGAFQVAFKSGSNWPNPRTNQQGSTWAAESGPFNNPNQTLSYAVEASGYPTLDPDLDIVP